MPGEDVRVYPLVKGASVRDFLFQCTRISNTVLRQDIYKSLASQELPASKFLGQDMWLYVFSSIGSVGPTFMLAMP